MLLFMNIYAFQYFTFFITSARYELNVRVFFVVFLNWN